MTTLCLGTAQIGMNYGVTNSKGQVKNIEVKKILDNAFKSHVSFIDTAQGYGEAEKVIGKFLTKDHNFNIVTKHSSSKGLSSRFNNINNWEYDNINLEITDFIKKNNIKFPILGKPIRYLLTNSFNGPSITEIFMILGKDQSLERLKRYKI